MFALDTGGRCGSHRIYPFQHQQIIAKVGIADQFNIAPNLRDGVFIKFGKVSGNAQYARAAPFYGLGNFLAEAFQRIYAAAMIFARAVFTGNKAYGKKTLHMLLHKVVQFFFKRSGVAWQRICFIR